MKTRCSPHLLTATALAASLLLAACGGGSGEAPPEQANAAVDATGPVVTITDSVVDATATGDVTFTFVFNEDVGTSFTADDVTVTGGTKGAFARVNGTRATLVVTPTPNSNGTVVISVAANAALDARGNGNALTTSQQAFDTVVPLPPATVGSTGTCTATTCTTFSGAGITFSPFENAAGGSVEIANDPNDATNKVVKFVKNPGDGDFFGTTIAGLATPVTLTNANKTVTLRVLTPAAGTNFLLKFEGGPGGAVTEKDVVTTKANEWETLSFEMPGTGTFTTVVLFPNGRSSVAAQKTMYVDELKFPVVAAPAASCAAPQCVDFSAAGIGFGPFENQGGGTVGIDNDPTNAANKVVKFVKKAGDAAFFGTTITGSGATPTLTATNKTITMRVYSPAVGTNFLLKLEGAGGAATEKDMVTTVANAWETLSFEMPAAGTYNTIVVFPNGRSTVTADKTMYIDDLSFPVAAAAGGSCAAPNCVDFAAAGIGFGPFENQGGGTVGIDNDPTNAANKVVKFVKKAGDAAFFGTTITGTGVNVVLTAASKTITMRVYSPAVGTNFLLKLEGGAGGAVTEKDMVTTVANAWETLSFDMPAAGTYTTIVVFPNGRSAVTADKTMYIDDLSFPATSAAGGGGGGGGGPAVDMGAGGPQTLTVATGDVKTGDGGNTMFVAGEGLFAVNFVGSAEAFAPFNLAAYPNAKTANFAGLTGISGGDIGYFQDDANLSNSPQKVDELGWVTGTSYAPNGVPNFFRTFVLKGPVSSSAYLGVFMNAPNNGTVNVSSFSKLKIKVWGPGPMFERTNLDPVLEVTLVGPKVAGCTTGSGGSEITQNLTANQKNGAGGFYTLPLSGFTVKGLCTGTSSAADLLTKVARVVVTVPGTSFNYTNSEGGNYATGVNLGPVGFTNN